LNLVNNNHLSGAWFHLLIMYSTITVTYCLLIGLAILSFDEAYLQFIPGYASSLRCPEIMYNSPTASIISTLPYVKQRCMLTALNAKGDGKSKKKKKDASSGTASPSSSPSTSSPSSSSKPSRVQLGRTNVHGNKISVRQQIAWAKAYKRLVAGSGFKEHKSKVRKDRAPKAEKEEYVEINYEETKPPAIFVDGYNIIGHMNLMEGRNIPLEDARDCLIDDLCVLHGATGWHIEVVFDAYMTGGVENRASVDNVLITYTGRGETADNHIERRFAELSRDGYRNIVVATDDNMLRTVAGSSGAGYLSAASLLEEFRIAYRGWETLEEDMATEVKLSRPKLGTGLKNDLREAMLKLKEQQTNANVATVNDSETRSHASNEVVDVSIDVDDNSSVTNSSKPKPKSKTTVSSEGKGKQGNSAKWSSDIKSAMLQLQAEQLSQNASDRKDTGQ
jgi:predicted RNA-binding protein with PIN domain